MIRVTIVLDFENNNLDTPEVYEYLKDLMENNSLEYSEEKIGE